MSAHQLEVRNFQSAQHLSEETLAFTASLYHEGKRIAHVRNSGTGGCNLYTWACPTSDPRVEIIHEAAREWAIANGENADGEVLDLLVSQLCDDYELRKAARKLARNGFPVSVLIEKLPYEFFGRTAYQESYLVGLRSAADAESVAQREKAARWRVIEP